MKVIIIYADREFAAKMDAILRRVAGHASIRVEWTLLCWSVDVLKEKGYAQKALAMAHDAQLIVLPAKIARSIPVQLLGLLEDWAKPRHHAGAALGILDDTNLGPADVVVHPDLSKLVHKYGLTLISNESSHPVTTGEREFTFDREWQFPLAVESRDHRNFDHPGAYRSFGINE